MNLEKIKTLIKKYNYINIVNKQENINFIEEIKNLKKEKNAIILGHFYQSGEVQDISDFVGDSLQLSHKAAETDADIIIFAGVNFMAETAKILSPHKKVILPDLNAGCSLADSCPTVDFTKFVKTHDSYTVVSYVNTTAEIKALSDIIVTSSNAKIIIESLPKNEKIIFAPDKNLGDYVNRLTGRKMLLWDGACHVHKEFSLKRILDIKKANKNIKIITHPECEKPIQIISDFIGSTAKLLKFVKKDNAKKYIVVTESGILHQMKKDVPNKIFIPAPPEDESCSCSDCEYMKLITLSKIYYSLKYELPEIKINKNLIKAAKKPIEKMLELSMNI